MRNPPHTQSGAALIVGLILLIAVTLMAVASMNTASLDLIMAGNEQYHNRAFHAAETGIEIAWDNHDAFSSQRDYPETDPWSSAVSVGTGNDIYKYKVWSLSKGGRLFDPPPGAGSSASYKAVYWEIASIGISERKATAETKQQLYQLVEWDSTVPYDDSVCGGASDLDATCP